jgi:alpha-mannosidase
MGPRVTVSPAGVVVTALRPSRDGKALMLRLFGAGGAAEKAVLRWAAPKPNAVSISDLREQPIRAAGETIDVPAWGVVTLRAEMP